jgi:hypothetical protein
LLEKGISDKNIELIYTEVSLNLRDQHDFFSVTDSVDLGKTVVTLSALSQKL